MKPVIYMLDDSEDALDLARAITDSDERFTLKTFQNESDMMKSLEIETPSALILDLNLGADMTGTIIAVKLRKLYKNLPMSIYTSYETSRVEKLIPVKELKSNKTQVWSKFSVGVANLSDKIMELVANTESI